MATVIQMTMVKMNMQLCHASINAKSSPCIVYIILKDQPKNVITLLKMKQLMHVIVRGMIREGPQIPLGCQAFPAPLGKYARHADNRGPSSEPCMPSVPGIPVAPLQVCLALNRTYLPIMDGMHILYTTLDRCVHISRIPIESRSDIQPPILGHYGRYAY